MSDHRVRQSRTILLYEVSRRRSKSTLDEEQSGVPVVSEWNDTTVPALASSARFLPLFAQPLPEKGRKRSVAKIGSVWGRLLVRGSYWISDRFRVSFPILWTARMLSQPRSIAAHDEVYLSYLDIVLSESARSRYILAEALSVSQAGSPRQARDFIDLVRSLPSTFVQQTAQNLVCRNAIYSSEVGGCGDVAMTPAYRYRPVLARSRRMYQLHALARSGSPFISSVVGGQCRDIIHRSHTPDNWVRQMVRLREPISSGRLILRYWGRQLGLADVRAYNNLERTEPSLRVIYASDLLARATLRRHFLGGQEFVLVLRSFGLRVLDTRVSQKPYKDYFSERHRRITKNDRLDSRGAASTISWSDDADPATQTITSLLDRNFNVVGVRNVESEIHPDWIDPMPAVVLSSWNWWLPAYVLIGAATAIVLIHDGTLSPGLEFEIEAIRAHNREGAVVTVEMERRTAVDPVVRSAQVAQPPMNSSHLRGMNAVHRSQNPQVIANRTVKQVARVLSSR